MGVDAVDEATPFENFISHVLRRPMDRHWCAVLPPDWRKRWNANSLGSLEATLPREMVSRRKILSRSRDDLNLDQSYITQEEEEDVWYQKEKLYKVSETAGGQQGRGAGVG
uniref:Uncharacterized protein n=1 Tax=Anopheles maculatus TaxID=74869 RepID=A0A182SB13_9DIPT